MKKRVFLYSGEGTQGPRADLSLVRQSPRFDEIIAALPASFDGDLEEVWAQEAGSHRGPHSPLFTVVAQICLTDLWRRWGYGPDVTLGHSTGELAAAYEAGLYSLQDVLALALELGTAAAQLPGQMAHGTLTDEELAATTVNVSSQNFQLDGSRHVTVSGYPGELEPFLAEHPAFVTMALPHPWHHPHYERYAYRVGLWESAMVADGTFVSGVTGDFETRLAPDHWRKWLVQPIDFIRAVQAVHRRYGEAELEIVEVGFHPVLARATAGFARAVCVSSARRDEDPARWILTERQKLDPAPLRQRVADAVRPLIPELGFDTSLATQGLDSLDMVELTAALKPLFLGLSPQDLFRHKTLDQLVAEYGTTPEAASEVRDGYRKRPVVIAGMSCRLPADVETVPQFWERLLSRGDQVRAEPTRGAADAGYLASSVARFDHRFFGISAAEARTMDPQQVLALELTELLWRDAGLDPRTLDRRRVGVYLGVWNQEFSPDQRSVYTPTGTNPSVVAARISFHYDLRGPSWVSNTACSSSLVAVHYAAKDIEAGRVDYAIAGGVNLLLDEGFSATMRESGFLSADDRCKAFDDSANGYVRAEGGGLVLLTAKSLAGPYYATVEGSATNSNGGRAQVITAPHPEAQEEVIREACAEAGIRPQEIAYLECHGTGTKLGDPIEFSALQNTVARGRDPDTPCYLGAVKSNIGHLESASGIAGLIKSVAAVNQGVIPPNLHFATPNRFIDFDQHPLQVVVEETPLDGEALCGVSSYGFGGSNAHVVLRGAPARERKEILEVVVPFDRERAAPLEDYVRRESPPQMAPDIEAPEPPAIDPGASPPAAPPAVAAVTREGLGELFDRLFYEITSVELILPDIELTDQGLDSLSAVELISALQEQLHLELEPELLIEFPLREELLEELYGLAQEQTAEAQLA